MIRISPIKNALMLTGGYEQTMTAKMVWLTQGYKNGWGRLFLGKTDA